MTGQISDTELIETVASQHSWRGVLRALGLPENSSRHARLLRNRCIALGVEIGHFRTHLRAAGPMLVAAFLTLEGYRISWPLEPAPYDLLVTRASDAPSRVQAKTSVNRDAGTWVCSLTRHVYSAKNQWHERRVYDLAEIDSFGVVDGDLGIYLIPAAVVGGLSAIHLRCYSRYRLGALPGPAELRSS